SKREEIHKIIKNTLSEVQYQTVLLYYFDELPVETIASMTGCPEGTVKTRLKTSRIKIKAGIESYEKRTRDSLAGMGAVPFLTRFFTRSAADISVPYVKPFPDMSSPAAKAASSAKSAGTAAKGAGIAAKATSAVAKGTGIFASKSVLTVVLPALLCVTVLTVAGIGIKNLVTKQQSHADSKHDEEKITVSTAVTEPATEITDASETAESSVTEETAAATEPVVYDGPVEVPLSQVTESEQLSSFISNWGGMLYDTGSLPEDFSVSRLIASDGGEMVDFSLYFDDYRLVSGIEDPQGYFISDYTHRLDSSYLFWVEENILNMPSDYRDTFNAALYSVPESRVWGMYLADDGYIYYAKGEAGSTISNTVERVMFDGERYFICSHRYDAAGDYAGGDDPGTYLYYTMELRNIDGREYWSLISCSDTAPDYMNEDASAEPTPAEPDTAEAEQPDDRYAFIGTLEDNGWRDAYLEKVSTVTTADFDNQYLTLSSDLEIKFDLIFINDDMIPELICTVCMSDYEFRSNLYTYVNGEVVMLGYTMYSGRITPSYFPYENFINAGGASSQAGAYWSHEVWRMNDTCDGIGSVTVVSARYDVTQYSTAWDAPEISEDWYHFLWTPETGYVEMTPEDLQAYNDGRTEGREDLIGTLTLQEFSDAVS
ncbi:MAG: hypothetical protein J5685_03705, partial [Clostridiales bacterium]|nr:hypothetical protein [Clostridiales bacterium]